MTSAITACVVAAMQALAVGRRRRSGSTSANATGVPKGAEVATRVWSTKSSVSRLESGRYARPTLDTMGLNTEFHRRRIMSNQGQRTFALDLT
jgi:hypothetical protein